MTYRELMESALLASRNIHVQMKNYMQALAKNPDGDFTEVLTLIRNESIETLCLFEELLQCFDYKCFKCDPIRVYRGMTHSVTYLLITIGIYNYEEAFKGLFQPAFCGLMSVYADNLNEIDIIIMMLESAIKEYCCPC